ncbi:MAG: DUF4129 domain-containing protein, partial [Pirellulales bacterium]|nr:DUF4129 domain-containing protein [Pirellulales bacterium]
SGLVRLIVLLALAGVVVAFLWFNREAIAAWWRKLWERSGDSSNEASLEERINQEVQQPPRAFASYRNPFGSENDPRMIVVITFQAFEAWTREQGSTRGKDETPSEFIRRIAQSLPQVSAAASQVVDAYNRIVYGRGGASQRDLSAAKKVWAQMQGAQMQGAQMQSA